MTWSRGEIPGPSFFGASLALVGGVAVVCAVVGCARADSVPKSPDAESVHGTSTDPGATASPAGPSPSPASSSPVPPVKPSCSRGEQLLGTGTSGLVLQSVQHSHDGTVELLVFQLRREASVGTALPYASASIHPQDGDLYVYIDGLSRDDTGNRPLFTESGQPFGHWVEVAGGIVSRYGAGWAHHLAIEYRVQIAERACYRIEIAQEPLAVFVYLYPDCGECLPIGVGASR